MVAQSFKTQIPTPGDWPEYFTKLIDEGSWDACLRRAHELIANEPTNPLGYEVAAYLFTRLWLFRTANKFIQQCPSQIFASSHNLQKTNDYLQSELMPMHAGLPVITSDIPCKEWLPQNATGEYADLEANSERFADDILSLEAFVANDFDLSKLTRNMGSIYNKMQHIMHNIDFSKVRILADLGGFDGLAAWLLLQYYPNIERIILADTVFPSNALAVFKQVNASIEFVRTNLTELDPTIFSAADAFLLNDVVEHIPADTCQFIFEKIYEIRHDANIMVYTPTLNHNNLERYPTDQHYMPVHKFDFWFWNGAVLSPTQINHVPAHLSYKSPGWLMRSLNELGSRCDIQLHCQAPNALTGRIYLNASPNFSTDKWQASGLPNGIQQYTL